MTLYPIPADVAYNVQIHNLVTIPSGGDLSTTIQFLYEVYPGLAYLTESSEEESVVNSSEESEAEIDADGDESEDESSDDLALLKKQTFEFGKALIR